MKMKHLFAILSLFFVIACSTEKAPPGGPAGGKIDPTKPVVYSGKPSNFNGIWSGTGILSEDRLSKSNFSYLITLKQALDADSIPKDIDFEILVTDERKDIIFNSVVTGLKIVPRNVDKMTVVYEIFQTGISQAIGQIGEDGFDLTYTTSSKIYRLILNGKVKLNFYGEKTYSKKKKLYLKAALTKTN